MDIDLQIIDVEEASKSINECSPELKVNICILSALLNDAENVLVPLHHMSPIQKARVCYDLKQKGYTIDQYSVSGCILVYLEGVRNLCYHKKNIML